MDLENNDINFYVLQLARSMERRGTQKWVTEIARVIKEMGGASIVPTKIGRSEPTLRRAGSLVIDEPLDDGVRASAAKRITEISRNQSIQAIFVHNLELMELAFQVQKRIQVPVVFVAQEIIHGMNFFTSGKLKKNVSAIDHIICVSSYVRDFFETTLKVPSERLTVIYEGFELKTISSQQVSQERTMSLAHSWGVVENMSQLVLIPAVYDDPVWCDNLVALAKELASNGSADIHYVVIGDDAGSGAMPRLESAIFRTAPGLIQLAGHCADVEAAVKLTATVLCLYSAKYSQFSDALIAQALGRFVFLPADCPASHEFIHQGQTGELLPLNARDIREAIEAFVIKEQEQRDGNFVASRSFIMKYFSLDEMHQKLRNFFESD